MILAVAEECELIARNPVRVNTRNRKLKAPRKRPVWLDSAEQIQALLDAATRLDASAIARTAGRRGFIAVLVSPGCVSARQRRCAGATSSSPRARSPSADRRPRPANGSSTSSPRCTTS